MGFKKVQQLKKILGFLKLMSHDRDLKRKAIELYKNGERMTDIAKILNVSKASVSRWLQNIEIKNETSFTILKPFKAADIEDWYSESVNFCSEIAESNRELRLILTEMLKAQLIDDEVNTKVVSCLSCAIERHTELEWKARGLDYLEANRAIARVVSMGYQVSDSSSQIAAEVETKDSKY